MASLQLDLFNATVFTSHQEWLAWLHHNLPQPQPHPEGALVFDLFAGCGGLALGFEILGFQTVGFEMKPQAVQTYQHNLVGHCEHVTLDIGDPVGQPVVLVGGPPCQPFSQIGYQRGQRDSRDGVPIFLDAVHRLKPQIAIFENVRGLLFRNKDYLRQTIAELERFGYRVEARLCKLLDYGVPQKRERVVVVASRVGWQWPDSVTSQGVSVGVALGPLAQSHDAHSRFLTAEMDRYIANYERKSNCIRPRDLHLDRPARTVTCRNLGGATSDMLRLRLPDGRRRMLTVREGARLQGFPDWFEFQGSDYEQYEQIGNAVSPLLSLAIAEQVQYHLTHPTTVSIQSSLTLELTSINTIALKKEQALTLLRTIGIPVRDFTPRRRERLALALLAVANLKPDQPWQAAQSHLVNPKINPITTREIIRFWNHHYGEKIADSSYDDVRRKDLVYLVEAGLVVKSAKNPTADTNDGTRGYAIAEAALALLHAYGTDDWEDALLVFRSQVGVLTDRLSRARDFQLIPVQLPNGELVKLSPGTHNQIQKAVIEEFLPRFSQGSTLLYLGDTEKKILLQDVAQLQALGLVELDRAILPDILAYEAQRNWLFMIEAVHSSNPINPLRHLKLREFAQQSTAGVIYVSAFATLKTFAKFAKDISWETEVWVADNPDHMIHFNGDRFLGPHS